MTALRRTLLLFVATVAIAVGAFAVSDATTHDDASGTPEHTVRDFLVSAVAEHDGHGACDYLTARSQREVERMEPRGVLCEAAVDRYARLDLEGDRVDTEAAVKALTYRARDEAGGRVRVTVSALGDSRSFVLRRATPAELAEFEAPPTPWRIASGVRGLLPG